MAFNFDEPITKPGGASVEPGVKTATVDAVELKTSKTGREFISVKSKLEEGGTLYDSFFDGDKPFIQYKMGQFVKAIGLTLSGDITLASIAKFIKPGMTFKVDIAPDDKGYATVDFSKDKLGYYPIDFFDDNSDAIFGTPAPEATVDSDVQAAVDDLDF